MENLGFILGFEWHLSNKPLPSFSQYALGKPRGKSIFWNEKIKNSSLITTTIITMRTTTEENSPSRSWCLLAGLGGSHPDYGEQECFIVTNLSDLKGRFKKQIWNSSHRGAWWFRKNHKNEIEIFFHKYLVRGRGVNWCTCHSISTYFFLKPSLNIHLYNTSKCLSQFYWKYNLEIYWIQRC